MLLLEEEEEKISEIVYSYYNRELNKKKRIHITDI